MKKNFFKKLSFVMALAMTVSMVAPAAGASAATAPHLNSTKKYLHLSGIAGPNEFDFNISHKPSGCKYEWTSANEDVVTVDEIGIATAVGVGTTKVTVVISDKKGEEVGKPLSATVVVRDNIETVAIKNPTTSNLAVGQSYNFDRSFTTEAGFEDVTSSVTKWAVDKETATISKNGTFVATTAGEYKVTALCFQSTAKYKAWQADSTKYANYLLATAETTVTVDASLTSVKQLTFTKAELTFDTDVSKELTKDNLKASKVIAGINQTIDMLIKDVKFDSTGKIATVEMYVDFVGGETYKFVYGTLEGSLVAAKADTDSVDTVVLQTKEAVYTNGPVTLDVKLYDVNGVDITTTTLKGQVSYELTNNVGYLSGNQLTLFAKGDVAAIKATFRTYKYDASYNEIVKTGTGSVVAVEAASYTIGSTVQRTLSKNAPDWSKAAVTTIAAGDTGYSVWARIRSTDTSKEEYYYSYAGQTIFNGKITFSSSNSDVLIVDTYGTVYPVKAGSAVVIVYYDGKAVDTFSVVVADARAAAVFTLDKQTVALTNSPSVAATAEVKLTIKDQLGDDFAAPAGDITFEALATNPSTTGPLSWSDGTHMKLTVAGSGITDGTYTYKVKVKDKVQILVVTIQKPTLKTDDGNYVDDVIYYQLTLDATSVDTLLNNDNALKTVRPTLTGFASNGVAVFKSTWADGFTYTVTKDGNAVTLGTETLTDGVIEVTTTGASISAPTQSVSGAAITVVSGTALSALGNGTYIVKAMDASNAVKGTTSFTVNNTQPQAAYVLEKSETTAATVLEAARDCFKVTLSGSDIADNDLYSVEYVYNGATVTDSTNDNVTAKATYFIKSAKFVKTYTNGGVTYAIEYTVNINRTIVVK